ncbi:MAG TPA: class I SAM-dependent methyltransferase [Candidatus Acidoferrales bacterium]|nr:class I SAM-dependent methyltransferase [Candidatus Acidoferrales bacterium]
MTTNDTPDWEARYQQPGYWCGEEPVDFLREHLEELPRGAALDLAMGEGRNAVFLAQHGFDVTGIEKSPTAIAKARERAAKAGVQLKAIQADLENYQLPAAEFDVVLCFHYLQRSLFAPTVAALKPGGALVVQTYTMEQLQFPRGPRRREHLLEPNELFRAFRRLRVAYYREVTRDERAIASLLAYKL